MRQGDAAAQGPCDAEVGQPGDAVLGDQDPAGRLAAGVVVPLLDEVEERHDVRMVQPRGVLRLLLESPGGLPVVGSRALDRDDPLQRLVPGLPHDTHPAPADGVLREVAAGDLLPGPQRQHGHGLYAALLGQ
ncbi:hypothetical protein [Streptomyces sp. UG1]|uniref:hypothetical protein n=1 Tax=Streptomyces sp. UG1 TaxID=3417652 RepID=UPI003CFA88CF